MSIASVMPADSAVSAAPIPIACVLGPTASGKTAAALAFAARAAAQGRVVEIVSVDSALVYRGMDIGTAKPDAAERAAVAHHLIDVVDPADAYSAARFRADALGVIARVLARGHVPVLVGGTMLYYRALTQGLNALPAADPAVRAALDADAARDGWPALHARLAQIDPVTAARLAPNDAQRIQRALEVFALSGQPMSALLGAGEAAGASTEMTTVASARVSSSVAADFAVARETLGASGSPGARAGTHTTASSATSANVSTAWPAFASSAAPTTSPIPAPLAAQVAPSTSISPATRGNAAPPAAFSANPDTFPISSSLRDAAAPYRFVPIALEPSVRSVLHERIARRFDAMLARGFIDEVKALRARGDLHAGLPSMRCVGYRQTWAYLDGAVDYRTMRDQGVFATRQLCKRQLTWLRALPERIVIDCCAANALDQTVETLARICG